MKGKSIMTPDINIVPLTPDLLVDYLDFFDNIAFSDNPKVPKCHCVHFHWNADHEAAFHKSGKLGDVADFIKRGIIKGYLAYKNNQVIGWCNANNKINYDALRCDVLHGERTELWNNADNDIKIKSIVCFLIAPIMRRQGVATQFLERVCEDAKKEGYECVEGYPLNESTDEYANHHGPIALYYKFNFCEYKKFEYDSIMRKYL